MFNGYGTPLHRFAALQNKRRVPLLRQHERRKQPRRAEANNNHAPAQRLISPLQRFRGSFPIQIKARVPAGKQRFAGLIVHLGNRVDKKMYRLLLPRVQRTADDFCVCNAFDIDVRLLRNQAGNLLVPC
ncbi:hypothetical protein SDC9_120186 [bioreactor metagenome]|uniref:Uncharacterized protein n=1 Tax=bioreactor metagenome TaxID=1076179 RepID=A0A645C634_9ZZZZ